MAGNIKGILLEIGGDTSGLQSALSKVDKETQSLGKELKGVESLLKFNPKNTELLVQKQKLLTDSIDKTEDKLKTLKQVQSEYIKQGKDLNTANYRNLQREIASTENKLKGLKTEAKNSNIGLQAMTEALGKIGSVAKVSCAVAVASIVAIGTTAVATGKKIFSMAKATSDYGDEIDKESQKLGISAENYQKLDYAMQMNGASIDDLSKGVKTITIELGKAEKGEKGAGKSFEALGVSLKDASGKVKSNEQVLLESVDALSKMENENQRNALAQEIFGKSSAELKPLLNSGADGIKELMEEAEKYGMVMSDEAVKSSAEFNDSLTRLTKTAEGLKNTIGATLMPSITQIMDALSMALIGDEGATAKMQEGVNGLAESINQGLPKFIEFLTNVAQVMLDNAPMILETLAQGIMNALPQLIPSIVNIIVSITTTLISMLPQIIEMGIELLLALIDGIVEALPQLIDMLPNIIIKICDTLIEHLPEIIEAGVKILVALIEGIIKTVPKLLLEIPNIFKKMKDTFFEMDWLGIGVDIIKGICNGLTSAGNIIWEAIKNVGNSMLDGIKNFFGIASPSKLMRDEVGEYLAKGIGVGFVDGMQDVNKLIDTSIPKDYTFDTSVTDGRSGIGSTGNVLNIYTQELDSAKLEEIVNYVNVKFGMVY